MTDRVNSCSNLTSSIFYVAHGILFTFEAAVHGYKNFLPVKHSPRDTRIQGREICQTLRQMRKGCVFWRVELDLSK